MSTRRHVANTIEKGHRVLVFLDAHWSTDITVAEIDAFNPDNWVLIGRLAGERTTPDESRAVVRSVVAARNRPLPADTFAGLPS